MICIHWASQLEIFSFFGNWRVCQYIFSGKKVFCRSKRWTYMAAVKSGYDAYATLQSLFKGSLYFWHFLVLNHCLTILLLMLRSIISYFQRIVFWFNFFFYYFYSFFCRWRPYFFFSEQDFFVGPLLSLLLHAVGRIYHHFDSRSSISLARRKPAKLSSLQFFFKLTKRLKLKGTSESFGVMEEFKSVNNRSVCNVCIEPVPSRIL